MGLVKACIQKDGTKSGLEVSFNPSEYSISGGANYSKQEVQGVSEPVKQYSGGKEMTLSVTLYFDTYEPPTLEKPFESGSPVTDKTNILIKLASIEGDLHRPPIVHFIWGNMDFRGVITSLNLHFTMFLASGMPVRARADVTVESSNDLMESKLQTPFESPDRSKYRTLCEGDSLWNIAYREYGSPDMWKVIAEANDIMNPLDVRPGQSIKIPAL